MSDLVFYQTLLSDIKKRIHQAQRKAVHSVNSEMLLLYLDIGKIIQVKQKQEGWGAGVIPKLSVDIRNELPEIKGFSERNIGYMIRFAKEYDSAFLQPPVAKLAEHEYSDTDLILPQAVAEMPNQSVFYAVPWSQHILLMEKIKDLPTRFWYMEQIVQNGWTRETLTSMIKNQAHKRQGNLTHNFDKTLPQAQSELVRLTLKDPYIFDFLTLTDHFQERELETELVKHLEKFLLELGAGFAFLGRQYKISVSDQDFYLDLFFYHIKLRCFIVIELKKGDFKPEYAGKMNFYCSAVDDVFKQPSDQPTIGLILCESKNRIFAEYALRDIHKPIGVSEYELTRALPENLKSSLPSIEEIEAELNQERGKDNG